MPLCPSECVRPDARFRLLEAAGDHERRRGRSLKASLGAESNERSRCCATSRSITNRASRRAWRLLDEVATGRAFAKSRICHADKREASESFSRNDAARWDHGNSASRRGIVPQIVP